MSAGGARRGRRDNGLHVAEYAVAGDVDPRVGEHLLDVLAAGGIAAYLQPSSDLDPVTRTTNLPARPTDRLFVDRAHLAQAREYLARLSAEAGNESITPEEPVKREPDMEREWARIVAGFDTDVDPAATPWPDAENISDKPQEHNRRKTDRVNGHDPMAPPPDEPPKRRGLASATEFSGVTVPREDPSLLDGLDSFGADLPDDEDDRYVPPPPPPIPRISTPALLGVLALLVGFVLLPFPNVLPIDRTYATFIGFFSIFAGFVTLIWRLRTGDDDDEPGDGAVV